MSGGGPGEATEVGSRRERGLPADIFFEKFLSSNRALLTGYRRENIHPHSNFGGMQCRSLGDLRFAALLDPP